MTDALVAEERRRTFHTLDALRGVAAIVIITRHSDRLFGSLKFPESYLAVDLFFVMSGVVIANAYEKRLRTNMSGVKFTVLRIIRLYPLYIVGIGLGFLQLVGNMAQAHRLDARVLIASLALATFMIPSGSLPGLSTPRWSLFFEMIANIVYGFGLRLLTNTALFVIVGLSAVGLVATEVIARTLDIGFNLNWSMSGGVFRVCYSFFAGVLIWRTSNLKGRHAPLVALCCLVITGCLLAISVPEALRPAFELCVVLAGFPLIVHVSMALDVGKRVTRLFSVLGVTSYAVYILHQPASMLFEAALRRLTHHTPDQLSPYGGLAFIALIVLACWALDKFYDAPVRSFLNKAIFNRLGDRPDRLRKTRVVNSSPVSPRP